MSVRLVITSPLEEELVDLIRATDERLDVVNDGELLAPTRYASDHPLPTLEAAGSRERWEQLLDEAEILFDFGPLELAPSLAARPRLRWIQGTSAGVGGLVERIGLRDSGVVVTTSSGVHARPLAEFALLAILGFAKDLPRIVRNQREHRWERYAGGETEGNTVCVVGLGRIGREVARLARALDMRTVGTVRDVRGRAAADLHVERLLPTDELDALLPETDAVVLTCPLTPSTYHLLDRRRISLLEPTAIVVNVARGQVVEEPAHSASTVAAENERIVELFCDNLRRYLDGKPLLNVLDKELLY